MSHGGGRPTSIDTPASPRDTFTIGVIGRTPASARDTFTIGHEIVHRVALSGFLKKTFWVRDRAPRVSSHSKFGCTLIVEGVRRGDIHGGGVIGQQLAVKLQRWPVITDELENERHS